jgi:hypothetical protein
MNVRLLLLSGLLGSVAVAGLVQLDKGREPAALPPTLSPHQRQAKRSPAAPPAHAPGSPDVRVAGLMINSPTHTGADPASDDPGSVDLAFFGTFERTRLALELERADGGVLGIDDDRSQLTRFEDDRGTNLAKADDPFGPFEMLPRISADGRHVVFVIPSPLLPDPGATRISAAGVLGLRVATRKETFTSSSIALTEGASLTLAGFDFRVESAGKSEWSEGQALTLSSRRDLSSIARYALVLDDGAEVELRPSMSMSGMGTWQQTLELGGEVPRAALSIEVWQDLATDEVPFEVETGIGLR